MWAEIGEIVRAIGIHRDDIAIVRRNHDLLCRILPAVVDAFYDHLFQTGHYQYFRKVDVASLKARQLEHWSKLFDGIFDSVYENYSRIIGHVHRERSVTQTLYMQSYGWFINALVMSIRNEPSLDEHSKNLLCSAVLKFVFFDMSVAMMTYHVAYID